MKGLRYYTILTLIAASFAACDSSRNNATLGGTKDTAAVAGSTDTSNRMQGDSAKTDTVNKGNADPTGRVAVDSAKR